MRMVRKGHMLAWNKGTSWNRSPAFRACCQWQPQLSKQRDFLPLMVPRECVPPNPLPCEQGKREKHAQDPRGVLGMIAEPTGTDGRRMIRKTPSVTDRQGQPRFHFQLSLFSS